MPRKKKAANKKPKKMESMSQVDGMTRDEEHEPATLDQVLGDDGVSKYKTLNNDVYKEVLENMSKADLKNEAIRVGLLPIDNILQLRIRLLREFTAHVSSYKRPKISIHTPQLSDDARKILEEGM